MCTKSKRRVARRHRRRGAGVVELAICLPLLVLVTVGFVDLTNFIFFRQAVKVAAYDAARTAIRPESDPADVQAACARLLAARRIDNWTLTLPADYDTISRGDLVQLSLTVPINEMTQFSGMDYWAPAADVSVDITAVKE